MIEHSIVLAAHKACTKQKRRYLENTKVGCFHCEAIFLANEIDEWWDEIDEDAVTAVCPNCAIDSVISFDEVSELGVTDEQFPKLLNAMKKHWFGFGS